MSSGTAAHSAQIRADLLLLLTALIWGFAFVAQRAGMEHVGPFFFNGVRFALGCLPLLPFRPANHHHTTRIPSSATSLSQAACSPGFSSLPPLPCNRSASSILRPARPGSSPGYT